MILKSPRFKVEKKVYALAEAAKYLGVCVYTLRKLVKEEKIKCRRAGRRYLFSKEGLDNWLTFKED